MLITDKGCRPMSCSYCKHHYPIHRYFYKLDTVEHEVESGFICTAFAKEEGIMVHMDGLVNDSVDHCEMYKERGEK